MGAVATRCATSAVLRTICVALSAATSPVRATASTVCRTAARASCSRSASSCCSARRLASCSRSCLASVRRCSASTRLSSSISAFSASMLIDDGLSLLVAQRLQDRRQQLVFPIAHALLMNLAQLGHLGGELLAVLGRGLQIVKKDSGLLVVGESLGHERLGRLVFPEHREQVLLFELGEQIEFRLESANSLSRVLSAPSEVSTSFAKSSLALAGPV